MSILSALNTGASGLDANSLELSVIGDNLANANTVGFKSSRAVFEDALAQTYIGEGPTQVGLGTRLAAVQRVNTQGSLLTTNRATDLALDGSGYFVVKGDVDGHSGSFYTRAGQFTLDKNGYLTNLQGLRAQGYAADATGTLSPTVSDLKVSTNTASPQPTGNITVRANLNADEVVPAAWNAATPAATSNFTTSTGIFDSLGASHQVDVYFRKSAAGAWEWHAMTDGGGLNGGTAGTATEIAAGTMTFGTNGELTNMTTTTNNFTPLGATTPQALAFNFGTATPGGTGLDGITQFSATSAASFISQDGYASGELSSVTVDSQGQLVGAFSNGQTRVLGQVAVATFPAEEHLQRLGGNLLMADPQAGSPSVGAPGTGGHASIVAGALEQSNVDMANEFIRMIAAQRAFEANSKTITTADSLLSELMNLKR